MATAKEKKEIRKKIKDAIRRFPGLDFAGLEWNLHLSDNDMDWWMKRAETQRLLDATDQFIRACSWLEKQGKRKTINRELSSYSLKHLAEHPDSYVSNGVLIAAAVHLGFKIVPAPTNNKTTAYLNISLTKWRKRHAMEVRTSW